jgi:hypothetical protein
MDPLQWTHYEKQMKICHSDGTLIDNEEATWREIVENKLVKSAEAPCYKSMEGSRIR